jgi:hypothetical protein
MRKNAIISIIIACVAPLLLAADPVDLTESMKESLVYVEVSSVSWEQIQPWKQTAVSTVGSYACAVGTNEVLAPAGAFANAVSVKARRYAQNEYIPATIKVIDYEYNLCLIELDKTALKPALKPLEFSDKYSKGKDLNAYWLSAGGHLTTARATLDRADVLFSNVSFVKTLQYVLTNPSRSTGTGEVYCLDAEPVGIACWSSDTEAGLIPAETINRFLAEARAETYKGFGAPGFETANLLDPAIRKFLKMPDELRHGIYVSSVYTIGTGSSELKPGDVILTIDKQSLNPYGRYLDDRYDRIGHEHLIGKQHVGDKIVFDVWRNEKEESIEVSVKTIKSSELLVPYYEYDRRPEFLVLGGFVFQKLTRPYMTMWGDGWQGKVPPHLYQYYQKMSFKPSPERSDIVLLSYVLPTEMNLGYQQLGRLVVKSFNGKEIASFQQIREALQVNPESPFHVVEFELDSPTVVIPKAQLSDANHQIQQLYGITQLSFIETK